MKTAPQIYLASQSPRRRELLEQIGIRFRVLIPDVNEEALPREAPADYVERIARMKAEAAWARVVTRRMRRQPVLAADTAVILGRRILGKPRNRAEAAAMLQALSGRTHQVITAVALAFERIHQHCRRLRSEAEFVAVLVLFRVLLIPGIVHR